MTLHYEDGGPIQGLPVPTLHYEDAGLRLFHGSNLEVLGADALGYPFGLGYHPERMMPDASFDSIVTDPPYELGFMGKKWDSTGIAYNVDLWRECFRALKPGGYLLAFGGTRTWHRIAAAIEDAGFEIRDSIAWMYGSGFPKSMDVATAVDKLDAAGERRARALRFTSWMREYLTAQEINEITGTAMGSHYVTDKEQPSVATAELFDMLRPHLPAVPDEIEQLVAERTVESANWAAREVTGQHDKPAAAQTWRANTVGGTVAPPRERRDRAFTDEAKTWQGWGTALKPAFEPIVVARKPLAGTVARNVLEHGTGALNIDACRVHTPGSEAKAYRVKRLKPGATLNREGGNWRPDDPDAEVYDGMTKDGRFPANVLLDESQAAELDRQAPKAGAGGKASGPTLTGASTSVARGKFNGVEDSPFYGDSGGASRFFPTFRYVAKAPSSERPEVDGTVHATVKPLDLMRWLVRLVTRRGGSVLDPFAGSGTTGEGRAARGHGRHADRARSRPPAADSAAGAEAAAAVDVRRLGRGGIMSIPELTPVDTAIFDDLVIEQMQNHFGDEVTCCNCEVAASARLVAKCCKRTALKCPEHLAMWIGAFARMLPARNQCAHCGAMTMAFVVTDVCEVVPL